PPARGKSVPTSRPRLRAFVVGRDPLATGRCEDRQFFHHILRLAERADHAGPGRRVPPGAHLLAGMTAPALNISVTGENKGFDLAKVLFVQPRFAGAVDVVAVIEHEAG